MFPAHHSEEPDSGYDSPDSQERHVGVEASARLPGATVMLTITVAQQPGVRLPTSISVAVVGMTGTGDYVFMVTSNSASVTIT